MKPHSPPSLPPIFVSKKDVDSDDAKEEDCVDRTISLVGRHTSAQHKKGQRSNGVGIWIWTRHGKGNLDGRRYGYERGLSTALCTSTNPPHTPKNG